MAPASKQISSRRQIRNVCVIDPVFLIGYRR
jgi:hypothetical protein